MEHLDENKHKNLIDEAIDNIRKDRNQTGELLKDLIKYLSTDEHKHKEVGLIAAKYVETLQRSNEQLVKIVSLKSRQDTKNLNLTSDDREEIFSLLNKESQ